MASGAPRGSHNPPAQISIRTATSKTLLRTWKRKIDQFSQSNLEDAERLEELSEYKTLTEAQAEEGRRIIGRRAQESTRILSEIEELIAKLGSRF